MPDLPLDWYGKNFLGRDVNVGVQGEAAQGVPAGGVAAIPSGALGSTGPGPAAAATAGPTAAPSVAGGPSTSGLTELGQGLQAAQLANTGYQVGSGLAQTAPVGGGAPLTGPGVTDTGLIGWDAPVESGGLGIGTTGSMTAPGAAGGAEAASSAGAAAAGAGLATAAEQMAYQQIPQGPRTDLDKGLLAAQSTFALPLALPDIISGKLWGPAPHMPFPAGTWAQLSNQVSSNLPQPLQVPPNATPEQQQQIGTINGIIQELQPYTGGIIPQLQGVQSAESWKYAMDHIVPYIKGKFQQLGQLYPEAIQAMQQQQSPQPDLSVLRGPQQATGPAQQDIPAGFYRGDQTITQQ